MYSCYVRSQSGLFHALQDPFPLDRIDHGKLILFENGLNSVHNSLKAAGCPTLLRKPGDAKVGLPPVFENGVNFYIEMYGPDVKICVC